MSDQIDKMLKEMEEFNKKYGLSTAGLSSSPSKKPTKPKKNVFKDAKNRRRYGCSPRSWFCRRHDVECGTDCRRCGSPFRTTRSNSDEKKFCQRLEQSKTGKPGNEQT